MSTPSGYDTWGGSWGTSWGQSWFRKSATKVLSSATSGAAGGYFIPDEFPKYQDGKRRWETDDEIFVIMGGPLH